MEFYSHLIGMLEMYDNTVGILLLFILNTLGFFGFIWEGERFPSLAQYPNAQIKDLFMMEMYDNTVGILLFIIYFV
jgi:hypothetical protein